MKTLGLLALIALLLYAPAVSGQTTVSQSQSITALEGTVALQVRSTANGSVQITGTWVGTLAFEGTVDGSTWFAIDATPIPSSTVVNSTTANGQWAISNAINVFRVRASAWTSGTAAISLLFTSAGGGGGGGGTVSGAVTVTTGNVALITPNADSAMNDTLDAAKVVVENVVTPGGQTGAAAITAYSNCTSQANLRMTTATTTELVALTSGELVRLCGVIVLADGDTDITFVEGTGANCATGQGTLLGPLDLTSTNGRGFIVPFSAVPFLDGAAVGNAICVTSSLAVPVTIFTRYTKY